MKTETTAPLSPRPTFTGALLAATHHSTRVSYTGLLGQCQRSLRNRGESGHAEMLRQLQEHLHELGRRWYAGDTAVVDEMLQLYCVEPEARVALLERLAIESAAAQPTRAAADALQGLAAYLRVEAGGVTGEAEKTLRQWASAVDALAAAPARVRTVGEEEARYKAWYDSPEGRAAVLQNNPRTRDRAVWLAAIAAAPGPVLAGRYAPDVDELAQFIRATDGTHTMGAGALAERIVGWLSECAALAAAPQPARAGGDAPSGIYVASRASVPERPMMWQGLRMKGWPITSTWIDEAGEGETADLGELWSRIHAEIQCSAGVLLYAEADDFPLKGALVECGIALGMRKPVAVVLPNVRLDARSMKPLGSWSRHPLVTRYETLEAARAALAAAPQPAAPHSWDASQIKPPGWNHVQQAFLDGAREARANAEASEDDFWRAADGYTKRVFEAVDPISEAALRTQAWAAPQPNAAEQCTPPYCLLCEKDGHVTTECWSTHMVGARSKEIDRLIAMQPAGSTVPSIDSIIEMVHWQAFRMWRKCGQPKATPEEVAQNQKDDAALRTALQQLAGSGATATASTVPATNCQRCSGSGEDPEGFFDQSKGPDGDTHDGPCRDCGGSGAAPAAVEREPQPVEMFRNVQWPKARDVGRIGDMSATAALRVGLDSDSDVYVAVHGEDGSGSVEFCTPGGGGGRSSRTREALIALMVAMEADNAEKPACDWWAKRNGIGSSKEGRDEA